MGLIIRGPGVQVPQDPPAEIKVDKAPKRLGAFLCFKFIGVRRTALYITIYPESRTIYFEVSLRWRKFLYIW